jgi:hypothetical protein
MRIPVLQGRAFTEQDTDDAPAVIIVSLSAGRRLWPGQNPIGKRLIASYDRPSGNWQTVVGVVGDVRYRVLTEATIDLYKPYCSPKTASNTSSCGRQGIFGFSAAGPIRDPFPGCRRGCRCDPADAGDRRPSVRALAVCCAPLLAACGACVTRGDGGIVRAAGPSGRRVQARDRHSNRPGCRTIRSSACLRCARSA